MYMQQHQTPRRDSFSTCSVMSDNDVVQLANGGPYAEGNLKIVLDGIELGSEVMCIRYNVDGTLIAAGLANGKVQILRAENGEILYTLKDDETSMRKSPVTSIKFKPSEVTDKKEHQHVIVATYASGLIKYWHYSSQSCISTINEVRQTLTSCFNPTGTRFLTAGADPQINIYDVETKKKIAVLEPSDSRDQMNGHRQRVFAVQYNPRDPHSFISGGWDNTIQFWDDRQKHSNKSIYGPHICGDGLDIDIHHNHILSSCHRKDKGLQIWDYDTRVLIKDVPQTKIHESLLYCGQWLGKDNIVCGGRQQNMARIIDRGTLNTVGQLLDLPSAVFCLDNDRQQKPKVAIGTATKVYVVRMENRK